MDACCRRRTPYEHRPPHFFLARFQDHDVQRPTGDRVQGGKWQTWPLQEMVKGRCSSAHWMDQTVRHDTLGGHAFSTHPSSSSSKSCACRQCPFAVSSMLPAIQTIPRFQAASTVPDRVVRARDKQESRLRGLGSARRMHGFQQQVQGRRFSMSRMTDLHDVRTQLGPPHAPSKAPRVCTLWKCIQLSAGRRRGGVGVASDGRPCVVRMTDR